MARRELRRVASSSDNDATDQSFHADTGSESACGDETGFPHAGRGVKRRRDSVPTAARKCSTKEFIDSVHQSLYEDPPDDTDEDLSDVSSNYGESGNSRKLRSRAKDRWQR